MWWKWCKRNFNINRREYSPERGWSLGYNPQGPSDKTVTVMRFDALSGKPIAVFINYPVHVTVMGPENYQISGDLAGATSRYVENYYRRKPEDTPRSDAGIIVTEYGVADLRGAGLAERARRLLAIAHPDHRERIERDGRRRSM